MVFFNENDSESGDENPPRHSEYKQPKYLQKHLNSINSFLLSLVVSYVGYRFKLLRMFWYKSMKPLRTKIKLVINKYLCFMYADFPGVDSSDDDVILN